jgi:hypothetical protein
MSRLFPGDRIKIASELDREGERLPIGTMGTVVSVDARGGRAEVDWDAVNPVTGEPSKLVLLLDVDPFWIELCTGYGPAPENEGLNEPPTNGQEEGRI